MKLNSQEKRTFILLLTAGFFNGFVFSGFQVQDIIAKKALAAFDWQIAILAMLWPVSNLFSIWWGKVLESTNNLSKYYIITALAGRIPLLLMMLVMDFYQYLVLVILMFSFNALISPAQNTIFQYNFRKENRGIAFGYINSVKTLVMISFSFVAGRILDVQENWFRYIFVVIAISGTINALIMAKIKLNRAIRINSEPFEIKKMFIHPINRSIQVLKENREFATFQRNFFIYGIGYISILPAIPKFLVEILGMNYTQTFLGKAVISQIGILILSPLAGKIFDKQNPMSFTALTFGILGFYPLFLFISSLFSGTIAAYYLVYFAFLIFGVVMSAVQITWNISSIYFAGCEDVSMYQSVHVTMTGVRGIIAPLLGYFIMRIVGVQGVFIFAFIMFSTASYLSYRQYLRNKK